MRERTYYLAGAFAVVILIGGIAGSLIGALQTADVSDPESPVALTERFEDTVRRAEANDPSAQYELARMYFDGEGGAVQNEVSGRAWLERAAHGGHTNAQLELGLALRHGDGAIQHFEQAAKWLQLAAEGGNPEAQYHLGLMYQAGSGVPLDNVKAYTWLNLAAARGARGAARPRDVVLRLLSPAEIAQAQAEARHLNDRLSRQPPNPTSHKPDQKVRPD